jgi:hypothetical protein
LPVVGGFDEFVDQVRGGGVAHGPDRVMDGLNEWQNRPLDSVYPVIFMPAMNTNTS